MVISQDGVNFDPADPANRQVRIVASAPGSQIVTWDGLTNAGVPFPVGGPYPVEIDGHAGEYHFPMLDVENNLVGGPVITLLNPPDGVCPPWNGGCRGAFYDDRGYISGNGTAVGTPGQVLCAGLGRVAIPPFSDPVLGFDTASGQRGFGDPSGGNANVPCASNGSFGDTKGVDLWTFYPGGQTTTALNIIANTTSISTSASSPSGIQVGETVEVTDTAATHRLQQSGGDCGGRVLTGRSRGRPERMRDRALRTESGQRSRRPRHRDGVDHSLVHAAGARQLLLGRALPG